MGDRGEKVSQLQYMLSVVGQFVREVPIPAVDGIFGPDTRDAVVSFQRWKGIPQTGETDDRTWDLIFDQFSGIDNRVLQNSAAFPSFSSGATTAANARSRLEALGYGGRTLNQELLSFQRANGLPATGRLSPETAARITQQFRASDFSSSTRMTQYPGYPLSAGSRDGSPQNR